MQMFSEPDQPKESQRNDFHFPLSTSFAEQNQAPITYIYIYARIQCLFVDFHMPLNKQSISRTNQVSTPQSCPNNLRSRLTTRTWSKRWGWE